MPARAPGTKKLRAPFGARSEADGSCLQLRLSMQCEQILLAGGGGHSGGVVTHHTRGVGGSQGAALDHHTLVQDGAAGSAKLYVAVPPEYTSLVPGLMSQIYHHRVL